MISAAKYSSIHMVFMKKDSQKNRVSLVYNKDNTIAIVFIYICLFIVYICNIGTDSIIIIIIINCLVKFS
jgi:hypothetical protein